MDVVVPIETQSQEVGRDPQGMWPKTPNHTGGVQQVKNILDRDSAIESTVRNLQRGGSGPGTHYKFNGEPQPLYMTLIGGGHTEGVRDETEIYEVEEDPGGESDWETDDETWEKEQFQDNWLPGDLRDEAEKGKNPTYLAETYWTARKADRKYRAAKGMFGPKKNFQNGKPALEPHGRGQRKPRDPIRREGKGFYIGQNLCEP